MEPPRAPPPPPPEPPAIRDARAALLHALANGMAIVFANITALRSYVKDPEAIKILADIDAAIDRTLKDFEALRRLL